MQVKNIMTRNIQTISPNETMLTASQIMRASGIRHLPVKDERGFLIGMLSDSDVKLSATTSPGEGHQAQHINNYKIVSDFMSSPIHKVKDSDTVEKVTREILELKLSCFIVEDDRRRDVGIVTTEDLLIFLMDLLAQEKSVLSKLLNAFKIT